MSATAKRALHTWPAFILAQPNIHPQSTWQQRRTLVAPLRHARPTISAPPRSKAVASRHRHATTTTVSPRPGVPAPCHAATSNATTFVPASRCVFALRPRRFQLLAARVLFATPYLPIASRRVPLPANLLRWAPPSAVMQQVRPPPYHSSLPSSPRSCTSNSHLSSPNLSPIRSHPSATTAICVVCMDRTKDIALLPCQHAHCCLACLRRSATRLCPICRTPVLHIRLLCSGNIHPVAALAPPLPPHPPCLRFAASNPRHSMPIIPRATRPSLRPTSMRSRATSLSSLNTVATQAESSFRSLSQWEHTAFRQLRETGSLPPSPDRARHTSSSTSCTDSSNASFSSATDLPIPRAYRVHNVVLIGHSRAIMINLAHRLVSTFPPPPSSSPHHRPTKSTVFINGQLLRLVLIECPPQASAPDIAARVQRQAPKLVLLCADFYNMSSFESVVRLDMDILDYLDLACIWVLMKNSSKRSYFSNSVDDTDVSAANHFLSSPRRCFVVAVDGIQRSVNLKKLGMFIHRFANDAPRRSQSSTFAGHQRFWVAKSWSLFCLSVHRSNDKTQQPRNRSNRFPRWMWH